MENYIIVLHGETTSFLKDEDGEIKTFHNINEVFKEGKKQDCDFTIINTKDAFSKTSELTTYSYREIAMILLEHSDVTVSYRTNDNLKSNKFANLETDLSDPNIARITITINLDKF